VVTSGPLKGTSLPLGSGLTIGRSGTSNLVLDDEFTSGRHAQIVPRDGQWYVEDLGSTNGTFVGRRRVEGPVRIEVGTPLRVGQTRMELR
jgi:pSer/pThr/pTyr-binding forkhead associated (FHA) protein